MSSKSELEELKKRVAELEKAAKPEKPVEWVYQPVDYTANASMSPATMREFADAAGGGVVMKQNERVLRQKLERIKQEFSAPTKPAAAQEPEPQPQKRGTGWRPEVPLGPPPGIEHCDRMLDAQDRIDRAELIERELKLAKTKMVKGE